jgi:predicted alpha-1,2-mannosidase
MKKSLLVVAALFSVVCGIFGQQRLVDFVNPFIGTGGHGHTYPGATLPFGMVQVGPDNGKQGWDWSSGYNYSDSIISGFSHTHLSGTGIGDMCDISVLPVVGKPDTGKVFSTFAHKEERASPGFYGVRLKDFSIYAEMTASLRAAMHRYAFPASNESAIRFNLGFAINWDRTTDANWRKMDDSTFVGYRYSTGWAKNQKVYFAVRLSKIPKSTTIFVDKKQVEGNDVRGKDLIVYLNYNTKAGEAITMKVGLSFADVEGALEGLNEIRTWDFINAKRGAADVWENELRKVQINSEDKKLKQVFYTALYHTFLAPTIFSDRYGNYKGVKGDIKNGKMVLSTHSLWDTFRAANPLLTITQTELIASLINSYLAFYDQSGYLPVWDLQFNETNTMTGYHAVPVIADAILKNVRGFDYEKAYRAMKRSAMQNIRGTEMYRNFGFIPADKLGESVTITMEYAFDDWCIAQVAKKLKHSEDVETFNKRANNWRNLFDQKTGFFRGKNTNGTWLEPFDPLESHYGTKHPYTEGNAWQHSFFVPQDVQGLKQSFASENGLEAKLDSLFTNSASMTGNAPPDVTGLIGQYAHGNEPSHHIAYLYNYLQKPWKTAERVREIMNKFYDNTPEGIVGNEDCGQMSAWYVFSALGFYPVNPASGQYVFGSPLVNEAILLLPSGMTFKLVAEDNSPENKYIQSITLNGKPYTKSYITHHDIMVGGMLTLKMGSSPGKTFGVEVQDLPTSTTPIPLPKK